MAKASTAPVAEVTAPEAQVVAEAVQELNLKLAIEQAIKSAKGQPLETQIVQRLEEARQFII